MRTNDEIRRKLDKFKTSSNLVTVSKAGGHWKDHVSLTSEEPATGSTINPPSSQKAFARPWLW